MNNSVNAPAFHDGDPVEIRTHGDGNSPRWLSGYEYANRYTEEASSVRLKIGRMAGTTIPVRDVDIRHA